MNRFRNFLTTILSMMLLIFPPVYFANQGKIDEAWVVLAACGAAVVFWNLHRFKKVKAGSFEAVIQEAETTIERLKTIAGPLLISSMKILNHGNRIGGMKPAQKIILFQELDSASVKLEFSDNQNIMAARKEFYQYLTWDHFSAFRSNIHTDQEVSKEISDAINALFSSYKNTDFPSENSIRTILGTAKIDISHENRLQDYLFFKNEHRLRRPEAIDN